MYAIIQYSGKQYRVQAGDIVEFDRVDAEPGKTITIESVLLVGDGENIRIGGHQLQAPRETYSFIPSTSYKPEIKSLNRFTRK